MDLMLLVIKYHYISFNILQRTFFDLPSGSNSIVHLPDGTTVGATRIWVRNNGTGTFHGAPWQ